MSALDPETVRLELAMLKHIEGIDYVTSTRLARRLEGYNAKHVRFAFEPLEAAGDISRWGSSNPITYRIEL